MSKCSRITFEFQKRFWLVITYWGLEFIFRLSMELEWDFFKFTKEDSDDEYIYIILMNISDFLSFFELFHHRRERKKEQSTNIINNNGDIISNENGNIHRNNNKDKCGISFNRSSLKWYLIILFILDFYNRLCYFVSYKVLKVNNEEVSRKLAKDMIILLDTVFRILFSIEINEDESYSKKHKIFAIVSIISILGALVIIDVIHSTIADEYNLTNCMYFFLILAPRAIFYPLVDTINWNYMIYQNVSPCGYMRRRSIFEFVLFVILTPILFNQKILLFSCDIFSAKFFAIAVVYIIICFVKSNLLLNVIYYYNTQSVSFLIIAESLAGSIYETISFVKGEENMSDPINIVISLIEIFLIILIGIVTLVYEEIMIINICGLNRDLKKIDYEKALKDDSMALTNQSDDNDNLGESYPAIERILTPRSTYNA